MKPAIIEAGPLWKRIAWFVGIWAGSVAALGVIAWLLRLVIGA